MWKALPCLPVFFALCAVSACDFAAPELPLRMDQREATTPFQVVPDSQRWVNAPAGIMTLQRDLGPQAEQKIVLKNATTFRGENVLQMRARGQDPRYVGRLRLEEFMRRVGGAPAPFTEISDSGLQSGEDALGPYFWTEYSTGTSTLCVLGIRRLEPGAWLPPEGLTVLDIMLRNCVSGTAEEALAPMGAAAITGDRPLGQSSTSGSRMLSPLAGPMQ
ncbi:hypothetical protein [Frigidibacter sp.]|uniref:hypothetical protein n=1 Tax=Frigidibacter sp. TaxID=2586418 RepID=UPI002732F69B|nr:hypothetical protein [Frigidibacter sp.]MDP3341997.1 hypothetical protein [Frigidibacter sp.]